MVPAAWLRRKSHHGISHTAAMKVPVHWDHRCSLRVGSSGPVCHRRAISDLPNRHNFDLFYLSHLFHRLHNSLLWGLCVGIREWVPSTCQSSLFPSCCFRALNDTGNLLTLQDGLNSHFTSWPDSSNFRPCSMHHRFASGLSSMKCDNRTSVAP